MAALRVEILAGAGSSSHGPSLVSKRGFLVKNACVGKNTAVVQRNLSRIGKSQAVSKKTSVRVNCRGSNLPSENDDANVPESVELLNIVLNSSDSDLPAVSNVPYKSRNESTTRPPKFSTLRNFGEGGAAVMSGLEGSVLELLAANVQATADLKRFETLSGRMAMMAFFVAIGIEVVTGNSVFKGIDIKDLGEFAALSGVATLTAAGFAFAWRARTDVASTLSKGALKLVDTAVDNMIDGLFFEEDEYKK
ncbi:stress enhanced protein 2, chloroplastic [Physcomitrium patens]|uniref:Uncharacterized protein n=1 Tax=Physcomitrium patens TaxID=3218 RepID=A9RL12_PHYPA|nr:stress enhanced protein 2, chloroplastic-like [Physcomitrium patens]PNR37835.1 hypothetical protein PHYPA_020944 [Physcomitrium patens]|eukprot:XP_024399759.1 stress enhanced protein 2, chloroplastic-like [Physcomitrella patens]